MNKTSDLDIPPLPLPPDSLRSLSRRLTEALTDGGPFDRAGQEARRIVREAAREMLKIAAEAEGKGRPWRPDGDVCPVRQEGDGDWLRAPRFARRPALVPVDGGRVAAVPVRSDRS
jgi:hypothetical protein